MSLMNVLIIVAIGVVMIGILRLATWERYKSKAPERLRISLAICFSIFVFAVFPLFIARLFNSTNSVGGGNYYTIFISMIAAAIRLPLGIIVYFMLVSWSKRSVTVGSIVYALMNVFEVFVILLAVQQKATWQLALAAVNCILGAILFFVIITKGKKNEKANA